MKCEQKIVFLPARWKSTIASAWVGMMERSLSVENSRCTAVTKLLALSAGSVDGSNGRRFCSLSAGFFSAGLEPRAVSWRRLVRAEVTAALPRLEPPGPLPRMLRLACCSRGVPTTSANIQSNAASAEPSCLLISRRTTARTSARAGIASPLAQSRSSESCTLPSPVLSSPVNSSMHARGGRPAPRRSSASRNCAKLTQLAPLSSP